LHTEEGPPDERIALVGRHAASKSKRFQLDLSHLVKKKNQEKAGFSHRQKEEIASPGDKAPAAGAEPVVRPAKLERKVGVRAREEEGGGRNRIGGRKRKARRGRRWRRKTPVTFALLAPTPKHFLWTDRESTRKKHYFREHRSMLSVRPHSHQVQQFLVAEEYTSRRRAPAIGREGEQLTVPVGRSSQAWFCPCPPYTSKLVLVVWSWSSLKSGTVCLVPTL